MSEISTLGIETWNGGAKKYKGKPSKLEVIRLIAQKVRVTTLDISSMNLKDLNTVLKYVESKHKEVMLDTPNCRTKAPYVAELHKVLPSVTSFNKLSVKALKDLISVIGGAE